MSWTPARAFTRAGSNPAGPGCIKAAQAAPYLWARRYDARTGRAIPYAAMCADLNTPKPRESGPVKRPCDWKYVDDSRQDHDRT